MYKYTLLSLAALVLAFALLAPTESRTKTRSGGQYQSGVSYNRRSPFIRRKTTVSPRCEWTCGDGSCIYQSKRCDHIYDCPDRTDEFNCAENSRCSYKCSGRRIPPKCYRTCDGGSTITTIPTIPISSEIESEDSNSRAICGWMWGECMLTFGGECGPGIQTVTSDVAGCSVGKTSFYPDEIECYVSCGVPNNRTMMRKMQRNIEKVIEAHQSLERNYLVGLQYFRGKFD